MRFCLGLHMNKHQIERNAARAEWFCIKCLRASDHVNKEDAELELVQFDCAPPSVQKNLEKMSDDYETRSRSPAHCEISSFIFAGCQLSNRGIYSPTFRLSHGGVFDQTGSCIFSCLLFLRNLPGLFESKSTPPEFTHWNVHRWEL